MVPHAVSRLRLLCRSMGHLISLTYKTSNMTKHSITHKLAAAALSCAIAFSSIACSDDESDGPGKDPEPPVTTLPELPVPGDIHNYKAPLYWSIYEYAREMELAGVPYDQMDCKKALQHEGVDGNLEKAVEVLRKQGMKRVNKVSSRTTQQGVVASMVQGKKGVMVEVTSVLSLHSIA